MSPLQISLTIKSAILTFLYPSEYRSFRGLGLMSQPLRHSGVKIECLWEIKKSWIFSNPWCQLSRCLFSSLCKSCFCIQLYILQNMFQKVSSYICKHVFVVLTASQWSHNFAFSVYFSVYWFEVCNMTDCSERKLAKIILEWYCEWQKLPYFQVSGKMQSKNCFEIILARFCSFITVHKTNSNIFDGGSWTERDYYYSMIWFIFKVLNICFHLTKTASASLQYVLFKRHVWHCWDMHQIHNRALSSFCQYSKVPCILVACAKCQGLLLQLKAKCLIGPICAILAACCVSLYLLYFQVALQCWNKFLCKTAKADV